MTMKRFKLVLVNKATGEETDSLLKGAGILSEREVNAILKRSRSKLRAGYDYKKVRTQ